MEKYFHFDKNKSLMELEGSDWTEPIYDSNLVTKCFELRRLPICNFTTENLRLMIGQEISLDYLIPLALEMLGDNVLSEGDLYCGDLLESMLRVNKNFWENNPMYKNDFEIILKNAVNELKSKQSFFNQKFISPLD